MGAVATLRSSKAKDEPSTDPENASGGAVMGALWWADAPAPIRRGNGTGSCGYAASSLAHNRSCPDHQRIVRLGVLRLGVPSESMPLSPPSLIFVPLACWRVDRSSVGRSRATEASYNSRNVAAHERSEGDSFRPSAKNARDAGRGSKNLRAVGEDWANTDFSGAFNIRKQTLFAVSTPQNCVGRDNLQAATKKAGDCYLGKLRRQENLDLSRRGIGRQDLEGEEIFLGLLRVALPISTTVLFPGLSSQQRAYEPPLQPRIISKTSFDAAHAYAVWLEDRSPDPSHVAPLQCTGTLKYKQGIVTKLRWLRGFTSVDLSDNSVDDGCVQPLKDLLALRQMRRLDLRGNDLGPSAGKALLEMLPRCRNLQVLFESDSGRRNFALLSVDSWTLLKISVGLFVRDSSRSPLLVISGADDGFCGIFHHHVSSRTKRKTRT